MSGGISILLLYAVFIAVIAYVLYFVLRKAIAHGIRDARLAQEKALRRTEPPT